MKVLLVLDLQKEFYKENYYEKILDFIERNRNNFDKIIATYFVNYKESNFERALDYNECMKTKHDTIEFKCDYIVPKYTYTLDETELISRKISKEDEIYIIGCDSDACIMATCFMLFDKGYSFRILSHQVYTTSKEFTNDDIIKILKRNFGKFVIL